MIIADCSDLDPINRKMYSVQYQDNSYWFRPVGNRTDLWVAVKDSPENAEYTRYSLQIKNKIYCDCEGYRRAHKCRHVEMLQEIKKQFKL